MIVPDRIRGIASRVIAELIARKAMITTAESCTGGLIAGALTSVPGSSDAVYGGYVTYSNEAKTRMIGVSEALLDAHGAVSEEVARAMAEGARMTAETDFAIAATGIAGPTGGSADKPVGLVHFAVASPQGVAHLRENFGDLGRDQIREASVIVALEMLLAAAAEEQ